MHVHLREPGAEESETVASGLRAAVAGGFTRVAAMPNTSPPVDTPPRVREMVRRGMDEHLARLLVVGCITEGREGVRTADIEGLAEAGAVAFSDDGSPVLDEIVLTEAMTRAERAGCVLIQHPEIPGVSLGGIVNQGRVSERLGVPGIPPESETGAVRITLDTARKCGGRVHLTHLSVPGSLELVRSAAERGVRATCDVTPHHLALDEDEVAELGPMAKMNPPLRSRADRMRLVEMVASGMADAVASDHAPHARHLKDSGLACAPFGITGLETALSVTLSTLGAEGGMSPFDILALFTTGPSSILGTGSPGIVPGAPFEAVLFDPCAGWEPGRDNMHSASLNTPFLGRRLIGRVQAVWIGRLIYRDGEFVD